MDIQPQKVMQSDENSSDSIQDGFTEIKNPSGS